MDYKNYLLNVVPKVDEIVDNFDFERVHEVMESLNWGWAQSEGRVPEIAEMKTFVRNLFLDLYKYESNQVSCGGFVAEKDEDDELELSFVVANWFTEGEN